MSERTKHLDFDFILCFLPLAFFLVVESILSFCFLLFAVHSASYPFLFLIFLFDDDQLKKVAEGMRREKGIVTISRASLSPSRLSFSLLFNLIVIE